MITLNLSPSLRNALTQATDLPGSLKQGGRALVKASQHVRQRLMTRARAISAPRQALMGHDCTS